MFFRLHTYRKIIIVENKAYFIRVFIDLPSTWSMAIRAWVITWARRTLKQNTPCSKIPATQYFNRVHFMMLLLCYIVIKEWKQSACHTQNNFYDISFTIGSRL